MKKIIIPTFDGRRMEYSINRIDFALPYINKRIERIINMSRYRHRTSMFDEFRPQIEEWCSEGRTVREMISLLPDGYVYNSLRDYIKKIKVGKYGLELEKRPVCDKCEYCKHFKNLDGNYNVANDRICTLSWRMIAYSVSHCPRWCEKNV